MFSVFLTYGPFVLIAAFIMFKIWQARQPMPVVEGSRVKNVESVKDLDNIFSEMKNGQVLLLDFYATWCPPCRAAAPVFGEWSKVYDPSKLLFAKVNVDKAGEVARLYGISAMPTFKVLDSSKNELKSFVGWRKGAIQTYIESFVSTPNKKQS